MPRELTWLHVSDLHFDERNRYDRKIVQSSLIKRVRDYATNRDWKPDLVFVTGDIAQKGSAAEYELATRFFDDLLAAVDLPRARLFVVPGNHDVNRAAGEFAKRSLGSQDDADRFFAAQPTHRVHAQKFEEFRKWFNHFFRQKPDPFSCTHKVTTVDIRDLHIGVLAANTALFAQDDRDYGQLWIGRPWLDERCDELDALKADLNFFLMHHPFDWLSAEERGNIRARLSRSVHFVLRGHLHDTEAETLLQHRAGVVHLAAGAAYQSRLWPRTVMLSRADLDSKLLTIVPLRYEDRPHQVWTIDPSVFPDGNNYRGELMIPLPSKVRCLSQTRTWSLGADGIATVEIVFQDLSIDGECVLAIPNNPVCDILAQPTLKIVRARPGSASSKQKAGRVSIRIEERRVHGKRVFATKAYRDHFSSANWVYWISNALARDQRDLKWMKPPSKSSADNGWFDALPSFDGRPHQVQLKCENLTLQLRFESPSMMGELCAVVERLSGPAGRQYWERHTAEEARCRIHRTSSAEAELRVSDPIIGCRYTLAYNPPKPTSSLFEDALAPVDTVVDACLQRPNRALPDRLTRMTEAAWSLTVPGNKPMPSTWLGMLWSENERKLVTCYGSFPPCNWRTSFDFGVGVAGHCLRFGKWVTWSSDKNSSRLSLIFQPRSSDTGRVGWVVCLPILLGPEEPAVGVVSFAGPPGDRSFLATIAQRQGEGKLRRSEEGTLRELTAALTYAFWVPLEQSSGSREFNLQDTVTSLASRALRGSNG